MGGDRRNFQLYLGILEHISQSPLIFILFYFSLQSVWFRGLWVLFLFCGFVAGLSGFWFISVVDRARSRLEKPRYPSYSLSLLAFH